MALETSGDITVNVDRLTAFGVVNDPHRLAKCIPGCTDLQEISKDHYSAVLSNKVAFMTLSFKVTIDVVKREPPSVIDARITGDAMGLAGHVAASAGVALTEIAPNQTNIRYTTEVGLTGKLGGLGQPVFKATSAKIAREFAANLKKEIEGGAA